MEERRICPHLKALENVIKCFIDHTSTIKYAKCLTGGIGFGAVNFGSFLLTLILPSLIARELILFRKAIPFKINRT